MPQCHYIQVSGNPKYTHIKVNVYYRKSENRGYYVSVIPVVMQKTPDNANLVTAIMGDGYNLLLERVGRASSNAEKRAIETVNQGVQEKEGQIWQVIARVMLDHNLRFERVSEVPA